MKTQMAPRVIFISGHHFGAETLRGFLNTPEYVENKISVPLIFSLHPRHALTTVGYEDLSALARSVNIPFFLFDKINEEICYQKLIAVEHHYIVAVGISEILSPRILDVPSQHNHSQIRHAGTHGCIGMHPTLLPIGRGRAPIPWAIVFRLSYSGVTTFFLEEKVDSGPIIDQIKYRIDSKETATSLFQKAAKAHKVLGARLAKKIAKCEVSGVLQDESLATYWKKRTPSDGWIDFNQTAADIALLVRSLTLPYPRAFLAIGNNIALVNHASVCAEGSGTAPGTILSALDEARVVVKTRDAAVCLQLTLLVGELASWRPGVQVTTSAQLLGDGCA